MGSWVPIQKNVAWDEAYLLAMWHLDPYSPMVTTDIYGPKIGGCAPSGMGS